MSETPATPHENLWQRLVKATRYTIAGIGNDTWMSPLNPLVPFQPIVESRQWDYPVGRNIFYTPRGTERISFAQLRLLARNSELLRLAIETRQDQMDALEWTIKFRNETEGDDDDPRLKKIADFLQSPDKVHDWAGWLRMILEELFVTDAVSVYRRLDKSGQIYALELIDGTTIFPLIDETGRQPQYPNPAYQQILKGVVKADYTIEELIYAVRKTQVNTPYGWSPTEQVIQSAKQDIERLKYQLSEFTEGSVPDAYITAPDGMTADKVEAYERHLNSLLSGNPSQRKQMPILLHGMAISQMKESVLKGEYDEWIARKICFAFSLPPTAFVKQMNRATADTAQDTAIEEGLAPIMLWVKRLIDKIITENFKCPDLQFSWEQKKDQDPQVAATVDATLVSKGILSINEVRADRGLDPIAGGDEPMLETATGFVPLPGSPLYQQMQEEAAKQAAQSHANALEISQTKQPEPGEEEPAADDKNAEKVVKLDVKKKRRGYGASQYH